MRLIDNHVWFHHPTLQNKLYIDENYENIFTLPPLRRKRNDFIDNNELLFYYRGQYQVPVGYFPMITLKINRAGGKYI